jgi:hypothetical protein
MDRPLYHEGDVVSLCHLQFDFIVGSCECATCVDRTQAGHIRPATAVDVVHADMA